MRVRWTQSALASLKRITDYIAADNPSAAAELVRETRDKAELLASFPMMGRVAPVPPLRELLVRRILLLVYEIVGDEVQIVMAWHTAQHRPTPPRPLHGGNTRRANRRPKRQ